MILLREQGILKEISKPYEQTKMDFIDKLIWLGIKILTGKDLEKTEALPIEQKTRTPLKEKYGLSDEEFKDLKQFSIDTLKNPNSSNEEKKRAKEILDQMSKSNLKN